MKLLLDTTNEDLFISIVKGGKTISYIHLKKCKKKSDILPETFLKLMSESHLKVENIESIYVVNGPGSFMGIRAGMTFAKTMAFVSNKKLFGIDNLLFISAGVDGKYFVDAKGSKSYIGIVRNRKSEISIGDFESNSIIDYHQIIHDPEKYLSLFTEIIDIVNYKANYVKAPQIGGV